MMRISIDAVCASGDMELAPITVVYGGNGTCKTSLARAVYLVLKAYSGAKPLSKVNLPIRAVVDGAEVVVGPDGVSAPAVRRGAGAFYLPSGRVVYAELFRRISSFKLDMMNGMPAQMSMFMELVGDYLNVVLSTYARAFLGADADLMMRDLSQLGIAVDQLSAVNHSAVDAELLLAVLSAVRRGAVVVVDDLDMYMDDSIGDAAEDLRAAVAQSGAFLFATVRRLESAKALAYAADQSALYVLRRSNSRYEIAPYDHGS